MHGDDSQADIDGDAYYAALGADDVPAGTPLRPLGRPVRPGKPLVALPPTPEEDDRFSGLIDEVAAADLDLRCTRCDREARLSTLRSRFGPPQYLNHAGGLALYEVTCPDRSCPSRKRGKGLEAIYREVKP